MAQVLSSKQQLHTAFQKSLNRFARTAQPGLKTTSKAPSATANDDQSSNQKPIEIPDSIINWLAQLTLLDGVPFEYLVPDAAMLPQESIRFFYLDQNWTNRLVDGAVNIALGSSQDFIHVLTSFETLAQQAKLQQQNVRATLRNKELPTTLTQGETVTGILLRSAVVSGWPGLEVAAYTDTEGKDLIPLLRMDRLSDNVLICLFNGIPERVDFSEPPEGLHFGVIGNPNPPPEYQVALRGLGIGGHTAGEQIVDSQEKAYTSPISFRQGSASTGVLDVTQIKDDLVTNLSKQNALDTEDGKPVFTSSQFAVQMVKGAGRQQFKPLNGNTCQGNTVKP